MQLAKFLQHQTDMVQPVYGITANFHASMAKFVIFLHTMWCGQIWPHISGHIYHTPKMTIRKANALNIKTHSGIGSE